MTAIEYALNEIRFNIPNELLVIAFKERNDLFSQVVTLDARIRKTVIEGRVIPNCSLTSGVTVKIPIEKCEVQHLADNEFFISVPKELTNNKKIITALSLVSNTIYSYGLPMYANVNPMASVAGKMYNHLTDDNVIQTARLEVVADNLIFVSDPIVSIYGGYLKVKIEYDNKMSKLNMSAYPIFAQACIYAVKSYLRNKLRVQVDQGQIYSGHELSIIRELIDEYQDAEEMYQDMLKTKLKKALFSTQSDNMSNFIKLSIGDLT